MEKTTIILQRGNKYASCILHTNEAFEHADIALLVLQDLNSLVETDEHVKSMLARIEQAKSIVRRTPHNDEAAP
jgi:predicted GTPase